MAPRQGCASWNGEILKKKSMKSIVWPQRSVSNQWSSPSSDYKKFHITLATASEHHHTPGGSGAWAAWPHTASLSRGLNGAIVERRCTGRDSSGIDGGLLCFRGKKWIKIVSLKENILIFGWTLSVSRWFGLVWKYLGHPEPLFHQGTNTFFLHHSYVWTPNIIYTLCYYISILQHYVILTYTYIHIMYIYIYDICINEI